MILVTAMKFYSLYILDPLGKFNEETAPNGYCKINEAKFDWVAETIFNVPKEGILNFKKKLNDGVNAQWSHWYCYGGYYYGDGYNPGFTDGYATVISQVIPKGNLLYVTCNHYYGDSPSEEYYIIEPKAIDGALYWTLHYAAYSPWHEAPPNLPEGFDYKRPVVPFDVIDYGGCGVHSTWMMNQNGALRISSEGTVDFDFHWYWFAYAGDIKNVVIDDGISSLCDGAFGECENLESVTIPASVTRIGSGSFDNCPNLTDIFFDGTEVQWNKITNGNFNCAQPKIHFMRQSETPDPTPPYIPTPTPTPTPDPVEPTVKTETSSDGTIITTTTWPGGKSFMKGVTPQGSTLLLLMISPSTTAASVSIPGNPGVGMSFIDVPPSAWCKEGVNKTTALGLVSGTSSTTFSPNEPMTRGMLVTVLHRLSGKVEYGLGTGNFSDVVSGSWYKDAVDWAQATGVVTGTGNGFQPNNSITREQLVTMLYRYAQLFGVKNGGKSIEGFSDAASVAGYAKDAMEWAYANGLISGVGDNRLSPAGTATRAQVAVILARFTEYMKQL